MQRILVVEDDTLVAEVIAATLEDRFETVIVGTAAAALRELAGSGFALMLLDCTLPGGMDPTLLPEADQRGVAVILMSGDPDRMAAISPTPRKSIAKPFSFRMLEAIVAEVLARTGG